MLRTIAVISTLLISTSAMAEAIKAPMPPVQTPSTPMGEKKFDGFVYEPKDSDLVFGKDNAPVVMVEYASLSCPHCAKFYKENFHELEKKYFEPGKVKLVYRDYPLNQPALEAAQMVHCAKKEMHSNYLKVLFSTQEKWAYDVNYHESLAGIAALGGMDRKTFDTCIANKDIQSAILLTYQEARGKFGVTSTPSIYINGTQLKGSHSLDSVVKALETELVKIGK